MCRESFKTFSELVEQNFEKKQDAILHVSSLFCYYFQFEVYTRRIDTEVLEFSSNVRV